MSMKINKNGKEYPVGVIPKNYPASNIGYNNSQSGLSADNVQGAIDELAERLNYSTAEHIVGKWIDGSDLYEKTIGLGQLPNNTSVSYSLGISSSYKIIEVKGLMASGRYVEQLETYYGNNNTFSHWYLEDNNFVFTCNTDFSAWYATVTVRYVKTQ